MNPDKKETHISGRCEGCNGQAEPVSPDASRCPVCDYTFSTVPACPTLVPSHRPESDYRTAVRLSAMNERLTLEDVADLYALSGLLGDALDLFNNTAIGELPPALIDQVLAWYMATPFYADRLAELYADQ